ncbi:Hypothetical_protein [Hexamita inflata]|uniref:Hypothetical_protein n=1 Tax=Hexamita inflata TaxID=28002 RepID=A0AA86U1L9_9EUKA|nr:Hypothetical protein HINF_LOCUS24509 [Hexamita inflata]
MTLHFYYFKFKLTLYQVRIVGVQKYQESTLFEFSPKWISVQKAKNGSEPRHNPDSSSDTLVTIIKHECEKLYVNSCFGFIGNQMAAVIWLFQQKKVLFMYDKSIIVLSCVFVQKCSQIQRNIYIYITSSRRHKRTTVRLSKAKHGLSHTSVSTFKTGSTRHLCPLSKDPIWPSLVSST